jgi:aryl-alcohol dehydrogenase-like predicted oxidoreductase
MQKRTLGNSGIEVSALGFGCWAIGGPFWAGTQPLGWGEVNDEESIQAIQRSLELGVTFFDTADVYGAGHSERVLAKALSLALKGKRDQVVIATKFGNVFDETSKQITSSDASPAYIRASCEASLRRLETDHIDLYQLHTGDLNLEAAIEARETLEQLVNEGLIRAYGWSTDDPTRAELFAAGEHCVSVQHQLNVLEDNPAMLETCERLNLASINRGPLAMGLLTGKFSSEIKLQASDVRAISPDWMAYFKNGVPNPEWLVRLEAIREVLTSNGRTLGQGALAWIWARSPKTLPIPGCRTVAQAEQNAKSLEFGPLTTAQMLEISRLLIRVQP